MPLAEVRNGLIEACDENGIAAGDGVDTLRHGAPLTVGGRVVGAIGVSGGADDMVAQAGVDALK